MSAMHLITEDGDRKPVRQPAERRKITDAWVRNAEPPATGRRQVRDTEVGGLMIEITAAGKRSWYLYRKIAGRPRRVRLADGEMPVGDARKLAIKTVADMHAGTDPVAERRRRRAQVTTLGELYETYGADRERTPRTISNEKYLWNGIKQWHGRRLDSIQPEDVAALHARIGKKRGKVSANRTAQLLRRLYRFARRRRLHIGDSPAEGMEFYPEQSRERFIQPAELPRLLKAIDAEPDPWPCYFRLLLLTGARRSALASMKWADVDLEAGTWNMPREDSKNKQGITVALVPDAVKRLKRRRKTATENAVHVFPARRGSGPMMNPYERWRKVRTAAGLTDVTLHDVRRTTESYLAANGVALPIIGRVLGHKSASSTSVYARLDLSAVRPELQRVADAMAAATPKEKATTKRKAKR